MMEFGTSFRVRLFGSSHGPEVGATIFGVPKGTPVDIAGVQADLDRRRPMGRRLSTRRREEDRLIVDAGVVDGAADGTPIRLHVANEDVARAPYEELRHTPRPGHADYPARMRFGNSADLSGGGIFSGRMTVGLVAAGAIARGMLRSEGVEIVAFTRSIGAVELLVPESEPLGEVRTRMMANEVGAPDPSKALEMERVIEAARRSGDSLGGVIECRTTGLPVGIGEPFFDSVESELAHLLFSIPAVKGVEFGAGFAAARMRGSEHNDAFFWDGDRVATRTNHSGGLLGGLTTGMPVVVRVAVKPTASIARPQETVDLTTRGPAKVVVKGRHDPCIVPRAVVVVEAVAAIALIDLMMRGGFTA
jgi:chorismate synthase